MAVHESCSLSGRPSGVQRALDDLACGKPIVVCDDPQRENEADLIFAAQHATPDLLGFVIRYTSGLLCCGLAPSECDRLELPLMVENNTEAMRTAFTVSVDAAGHTTTGISASDRSATLRALAFPATQPSDLLRPGHVFPLRAYRDGVLGRPGHTEAAVDLVTLAGLHPAGALCELVGDDGELMRERALTHFASEHCLTVISVADIVSFRSQLAATRVKREAS